eukprot:2470553-Karenia_brevis.AAC.1
MPGVSAVQAAKRAFVCLLLSLARKYNVSLSINRDSSDRDVVKAFKKVSLKVHPDKGGTQEESQQLNAARQSWEDAKKATEQGPHRSEPPAGASAEEVSLASQAQKGFRVNSVAVLLTFNGLTGLPQWEEFRAF